MKLPGKLVILGLGVLTTLLMAGVWLSGVGAQLELWCLDWAFGEGPNKTTRDDLIHVDIDDQSIEELGRWPWPREHIAGYIGTLKELGAARIALDVQFPRPQEPRYVSDAESVYRAFEQTLHEAPPVPVYDDAILSQSIRNAGNVVLAMQMAPVDEPALRFEREIEGYLTENPETAFIKCATDIAPFDPRSPLSDKTRNDFHEAYLLVRARMALKPSTDYGRQASEQRVEPPLVTLAQEANDVAVVNAEIDNDGKVRRTRLLFSDGEKTYKQFALSLAIQTLQKACNGPIRLETNETQLLIYAGSELVRKIELVEGSMLINWSLGTGLQKRQKHRRISARDVARLWQEKRRLAGLEKMQYAARARWISMGTQIADATTEELYWNFADEVSRLPVLSNRRRAMERRSHFNRLYDPCQPSLDSNIDLVRGEEQKCERRLFQMAKELFEKLSKDRDTFYGKPSVRSEEVTPEQIAEYEQRVRQADEIETALREIPRGTADLEKTIREQEERLVGLVTGKICLIGSTARESAVDAVPTPLGKWTPGINVHASIYDTIVSGEMIRPASLSLNLTAIFAAGLIVSLLSLRMKAAMGGPIVIGLAILYAFLNTQVFLPRLNVHMAMAFPVGTMLCVFVVLTVYRELTEGRQKTYIKQAFKHYLSGHVIEQILHDPQALQLGGEKRELTIMFTDLAGFSTFSEKLSPEELTTLLNDYLTEMTDIIMEEGGTLDKYEGDAIIAFWNAPLTLPDHAVRACHAVLRCQRRLEELRQTYADRTGAELRMRVGVNTGEVVVGNMGSTQRFNYTILGDAANLAARLEGANKAFGTETMISENTWRLASSEFQGRKLADLRVVGRKTPMIVYEMTGLSSDAASPEWATFSEGLDQFRAGDFAAAAKTFKTLPDDPAASRYVERCEAFIPQPPGNWHGVWEMTSK